MSQNNTPEHTLQNNEPSETTSAVHGHHPEKLAELPKYASQDNQPQPYQAAPTVPERRSERLRKPPLQNISMTLFVYTIIQAYIFVGLLTVIIMILFVRTDIQSISTILFLHTGHNKACETFIFQLKGSLPQLQILLLLVAGI